MLKVGRYQPQKIQSSHLKSFVPVLPIERDLVITQDSCLATVLLQFIHELHSLFLSFYFVLVLQAPSPKFSRTRTNVLWPQRFLLKFFFAKDSRSGDNLLSPLRSSLSLSRRKPSRKSSGTKLAQMSLLAG